MTHNQYSFEPLYSLDKLGRTRVWYASVKEINGYGISTIRHGLLDGTLQEDSKTITQGKNIGKKNETSPYKQCLNEIERKWKDKIEKEGYVTDKNKLSTDDSPTTFYPMLAHKYNPNGKQVNIPYYVQPKLDGLRCVIYKRGNDIIAQSRTGGIFTTVSHITEELRELITKYPNVYLDGELYTDEYPFEELVGLIKKKKMVDPKILLVKYHVYDLYTVTDSNMIYNDRLRFIEDHIVGYKNIEKVQTYIVNKQDEFKTYFDKFIMDGYEGIMIRNMNGIYGVNQRSHDLLKYKEFVEDEYRIVGYKSGTGRDEGTIIFTCVTAEGNEFCVRPRGCIEYRKELFQNGDKHIGKMLTVIYQELSELNVPRFPVGKSIRDGF